MMKRVPGRMLSLVSIGARSQMGVAIALVAIIPLLSFMFVVFTAMGSKPYTFWVQILICLLALIIGSSGGVMLRQYPRHIVMLRAYLRDIAGGILPQTVEFRDNMDDITAIAKYLNTIVIEMRRRVEELEAQLALSRRMQETIQGQAQELLEAERHRVMIESLGSACHHIGQPATVLRIHLDSIAKTDVSPETRQRIEECRQAMDSMTDILYKLRNVSEYRTVPFKIYGDVVEPCREDRILDIGRKTS